MTKTHYFYGCSMTAGDELSDGTDEYPFKLGVTPAYYTVKANILHNPLKMSKYEASNKKMAYPAILNKKYNIDTLNLAENGMSLRHIVSKIISLVINSPESIDHIHLQVPVMGREQFITSTFEASIQLTQTVHWDKDVENYRRAKLLSHSDVHISVEDIQDLILLNGFLKSKNINLTVIEINNSLANRFKILIPTRYQWMSRFKPELSIFSVDLAEDWHFTSWHMNQLGHEKFADLIKTSVIDKL